MNNNNDASTNAKVTRTKVAATNQDLLANALAIAPVEGTPDG